MEKVLEKNINTIDYWNTVWKNEREKGKRRLSITHWDKMLKFVPDGQPLRAVDIGCGAGKLLKYFSEKRPQLELYGCDIARQGIKTAKENLPHAKFIVCSEHDFGLPVNYFDIVICSEVLEHVDAPKSLMQRLTMLAKIQGKLFITVPWNWGIYKEHVWQFTDREDVFNLNPKQLKEEQNIVMGKRLISILQRIS